MSEPEAPADPSPAAAADAADVDRAALVRRAARLLGSREAAEEVVQEALLRHVERFAAVPSAAPPDSSQAWLARVTRNLAVDRLRRARREREARETGRLDAPDRPAGGPEEALERRERRRDALDALLAGSEPRDVAAVVLRESFGVPYADIARGGERDAAAWRQAVHRALGRARERAAGGGGARPGRDADADAVRDRFERAVAERDARPLFDALRVEACAPGAGGPAATLRFEIDAGGARLALVLDGRVLCRLRSVQRSSTSAGVASAPHQRSAFCA